MKDLVVFDVETTGLNKKSDYIIQISAIKINGKTGKIISEFNEYVKPASSYTIAIPAYMKHGIKPDMLEDKPTMKEIAPKFKEFLADCDVLTYKGTSFDIEFVYNECLRNGVDIDFVHRNCYDSYLEEHRRHKNTLECAFERYTGKTMEESGLTAHDALSDVKATYEVFKHQARSIGKLFEPENIFGEDGIISMMQFGTEKKPCFAVGKHRGESISYVKKFDINYLEWCVSDKSNFCKRTKEYIKTYL